MFDTGQKNRQRGEDIGVCNVQNLHLSEFPASYQQVTFINMSLFGPDINVVSK